MWEVEGVTENRQRAEQAPLLSLRPLPNIQHHSAATALPCPGEYLRLCPTPLHNRHTKTKKKAQMKEQIKAPEKIQLCNQEIANLSDAQFKTLVIRDLLAKMEA